MLHVHRSAIPEWLAIVIGNLAGRTTENCTRAPLNENNIAIINWDYNISNLAARRLTWCDRLISKTALMATSLEINPPNVQTYLGSRI